MPSNHLNLSSPSPPPALNLSQHQGLFLHHHPSEGRQTENQNHRKLTNLITWPTALSNSMKLWAMPYRTTQDGRVMVESSDKTWSTGEGNANHFSILWEPHEQHEKTKRYDTERWAPQVGRCAICLLEISGEITPERMKRRSQSKNSTQLWMWLVMEVKSDAAKSNIA